MSTIPHEDTSDVLPLSRAPLSGGHWVTIHEEPVYIRDGQIVAGPKNLNGKTLSDAAEEGKHVSEVHGDNHPETGTPEGPPAAAPKKHTQNSLGEDLKSELGLQTEEMGWTGRDDDDLNYETAKGNPFQFHNKLPGEVKDFLEGRAHLRKLFTTTTDNSMAGGGDAMATLGDRYWELAEKGGSKFGGSVRLEQLIEAGKSENATPRAQMLSAVLTNLPPARIKGRDGKMKANPDRGGGASINPAEHPVGTTFTLHGEKMSIVRDASGGNVIRDGDSYPELPADMVGNIPVDEGSIAAPAKTKPSKRRLVFVGDHDVIPFSAPIYLSAPADLIAAVTLGQGLPAEHNGLPIHYRWVDSAVCGEWQHPRTGEAVPINAARVGKWVANLKLALSRKVDVPAVKDHSEKADASLGAIYDARSKDDRLQLLAGFYGDDALGIAQRNKVSVGIDPNFKDSHGNSYGESIRHLAFTPVPVIHGQHGFIAASRGEPTEAVYLSLAPESKGVEMIDPGLYGRVTQHLGDDATDDANEAILGLLDKLDTAKATQTQLSAAVEAAKPKPADPALVKMATELSASNLDNDVLKGDMPRAFAETLKADLAKEGTAIYLSRGGALDTSPIQYVRDLFKGSKLGLIKPEATNVQTLSREVPDGKDDPALRPNPHQADIDAAKKAAAA